MIKTSRHDVSAQTYLTFNDVSSVLIDVFMSFEAVYCVLAGATFPNIMYALPQ